MEAYIPISELNDFLFCPKSIYFHHLYGKLNASLYHDKPQIAGKINHECIDEGEYSSSKHFLQGMEIYSAELGLCGKIDILDTKKHALIERKTKIQHLYEGYIMQVYAQYYCLQEMGYRVDALFLHSLKDNKRYVVPIPTQKEREQLEALITQMKAFDMEQPFVQVPEKCRTCIYRHLCNSNSS